MMFVRRERPRAQPGELHREGLHNGGTTTYLVATVEVNHGCTWTASTTTRVPPLTSSAAGAARVAACWYSPSPSFTVDVNLTTG